MQRKLYTKPVVLNHELITFETLLSCKPPNEAYDSPIHGSICIKPDLTWFKR